MSLLGKFKKRQPKIGKIKKAVPRPELAEKESVTKSAPLYKKFKPGTSTSSALVRPIITEKASQLEKDNKYIFEVNRESNKNEIRKAIKEIYGVQPVKINAQTVLGKAVRYGRSQGRTKKWKKAIVTLKKGDKLALTSTK